MEEGKDHHSNKKPQKDEESNNSKYEIQNAVSNGLNNPFLIANLEILG